MNQNQIDRLMLEIENVDWSTTSHAYSVATDVPDMLRKTLSDDPQTRAQAWEYFWSSIIHQGTRYAATAQVARVLIPWLEEPENPSLLEVWGFLEDLVGCDDSILALSEDSTDGLADMYLARQAALEGWPVYVRQAFSENPEIRLRAYQTLGYVHEQVDAVFATLERRYVLEDSSYFKGSVLMAQAILLRPLVRSELQKTQTLKNRLERLMQGDTAPLELRVDALRAWAILEPKDLPKNTVALFLEVSQTLSEPNQTKYGYGLWGLSNTLNQRLDLQHLFFVGLLEHPAAAMRERGVSELQSLATKQRSFRAVAVDNLVAHFKHETDAKVRADTVLYLGMLGSEAEANATPFLLKALLDTSEEVRLRAACALAKLQNPRAIPVLLELLESRDLMTLETVARALNDFSSLPPEATPPFLQAMRRVRTGDYTYSISEEDIRVIFHYSEEEAQEEVLGYFIHMSNRLTDSLGETIDELIYALKNPVNWRVVNGAAQRLGERQDPRAVPALLEALSGLSENDPSSYRSILDTLAIIGDSRILPDLIQLWPPRLNRHHWNRIESAYIQVLATLGGVESIPFLEGFKPTHPGTQEELDRILWILKGSSQEHFERMLDYALEQERWVALKPLLEHIQPNTPHTKKVLPFLYQVANDLEHCKQWEQFTAARAILRLTGDVAPLEESGRWFAKSNWGRSRHFFEQIEDLGQHIAAFRPMLEQLAYAEYFQTGSYSADTIKEDEYLQTRALEMLHTLEEN
jgi:HEAT repeat protein